MSLQYGSAPPTSAVSVIVPVYNAERHLDAVLDSVLGQSLRELEVIAVHDGSTDGSRLLLDRRAAGDPRLVVIRHDEEINRGVAASRNLGLRRARGEYVWFVDADDRVRPGTVSTLLATAQHHRADVVAFNGAECGGCLPDVPVYRQPKPSGVSTGDVWVSCCCRQQEWRHFVWLRFYRRGYLDSCGLEFRDGIVHEDIAWITEGDLRAERFVYVDAILYDYARSPESITRREDDASLLRRAESMFEVVAQLRNINSRCPMPEETRTRADMLRFTCVMVAGLLVLTVMAIRQPFDPSAASREPAYVNVGWLTTWLVTLAPSLIFLLPPGSPSSRNAVMSATVLTAALSCLFVSAWLSGNRVVWACFAVMVLVGASLGLRGPRTPGERRRTLAIAALLLLVIAAFMGNSMRFRAEASGPQAQDPVAFMLSDSRAPIWREALEMISERPLRGYGYANPEIADAFSARFHDPWFRQVFRHAHNVVLDYTLQMGVIGGGAVVALFAALAWAFFRRSRGHADGSGNTAREFARRCANAGRVNRVPSLHLVLNNRRPRRRGG